MDRLTEDRLRKWLARNVRALRTGAKLTLEEAAWRGSLNTRHWARIETGTTSVTLRTLANLANALGVSPAELLAEPPAKPPAKRRVKA